MQRLHIYSFLYITLLTCSKSDIDTYLPNSVPLQIKCLIYKDKAHTKFKSTQINHLRFKLLLFIGMNASSLRSNELKAIISSLNLFPVYRHHL